MSRPKSVRCAIYTRKSSEEGLDQAFNSLHAQREACEAYVKSQAGEGWEALSAIYDDGGFSGGNIERPALRRLLDDIERGAIDIVVVYKVDRLTRSLTDFAKIVERFDKADVSFVSVTQAFNTTTSMGRLTLNVLLSFAQFEREVTGERIRDKIAASKAKGMWMGGNLPLGYDAPTDPATRALVVNEAEAETVRLIFNRYLQLKSVHQLARWLKDQEIRTKLMTFSTGRSRGGTWFNRGALFHVLKNRTYLGEIPHRDRSYPGAHPPIVEHEVFEAAQLMLKENARAHVERPLRTATAPMKGKLFDAEGKPMSPTFSLGKSGRSHRYYVSTDLQTGGDGKKLHPQRLSAPVVEDLLARHLARLLDLPMGEAWGHLGLLARVDVRATSMTLSLAGEDRLGSLSALARRIKERLRLGEDAWLNEGVLQIHLPVSARVRGGRTWLRAANGGAAQDPGLRNKCLLKQLRNAHAALRRVGAAPEMSPLEMSKAQSPTYSYERKIAPLAFLAPDLQQALVKGRLITERDLVATLERGLPLLWREQRAWFSGVRF